MNPAGAAVPFWLPARFLLVGAIAFAAAGTTLALEPALLLTSYAASGVLAIVHLMTLGFLTSVFVGAMHQLMPVVLVTQLSSIPLGRTSFWLLLAGAAAVIAGFGTGYRPSLLAAGGTLMLLGLLAFDLNLWRTWRTATVRDEVGRSLLYAAGYLTLTVAMGLLLALGRLEPQIGVVVARATLLHLGLGLFGGFFLAIAGAGHKLLGMFTLSHGHSLKRLRWACRSVHATLLAVALDTFTQVQLLPLAAALLLAAVLLFAADVAIVLRKRLRRRLGPPLLQFTMAPLFLVAGAVLALAGELAAAVAAMLFGFVTLSVGGMFVKILGFLTWQHRYAPLVGKEPVPLLNDMPLTWLDRACLAFLAPGAALLVASQLSPHPWLAAAAGFLLAAGSWSLLAQAIWILFGSHRPGATAPRVARA